MHNYCASQQKMVTMTAASMKKKDGHKKDAPANGARPRQAATKSSMHAVNSKPQSNAPRRTTMTPSMEHIEKGTQGMMQAYEELNAFSKAFGEATMQSAAAMTKGWDELARAGSGIVQESMARMMNAGKTIGAAKNPREAMDMQAEFMKDCFDCWVAGTGKLSEISARVTQEVIDPVAQHANAAMSKMMIKARAA